MSIIKRTAAFLALLTVTAAVFGCGDIKFEQQSECDKNGHEWEKATCTKPKTCEVCDKTKGEPLGHTWLDATCKTPKTCEVCGDTEGEPAEHAYTEEIIKAATCAADGEISFTCDLCGDTYTEAAVMEKFDGSEIREMIKASICEIITYDKSGNEYGLGSGFVYGEDGKIVTNYHVIEGACSAVVTLDGSEYKTQYVLAYDKTVDLAVLQIDARGLKPLTVCNNDHTVGKAVYAMGSSKGVTNTFSAGTITNEMREEDGVEYVQHDAAISSGNSGGPLINEYCEVIGINTLTLRDSQNLNFAVSVRELDGLDYSKKMTLEKVYEAECDAYTVFMEYIIAHGEYDSDYNLYEWDRGYEIVGDGLRVHRYYQYDLDYENIGINISISNGDSTIINEIYMDSANGTYEWDYFDSDFDTIEGYLYANTFTGDSLGYYSETFDDYDMLSDALDASEVLLDHACSKLDSDLAIMGLEAEDFGFIYY